MSHHLNPNAPIEDRVLFRFPRDPELQWAAVAVAQSFVNTFDLRMATHMKMIGEDRHYKLRYGLEISGPAWAVFRRAGLVLMSEPAFQLEPDADQSGRYDLVADMTEERLALFPDQQKHAAQIFGTSCGVDWQPLPEVRPLACVLTGPYAVLDNCTTGPLATVESTLQTSGQEILEADSVPWRGVIGYQGWETYAAASRLLCSDCRERIFRPKQGKQYVDCQCGAVIEILPAGRSRSRLSKFRNSAYRLCIEDNGTMSVPLQIQQAMENLDQLARMRTKRQQEKSCSAAAPILSVA